MLGERIMHADILVFQLFHDEVCETIKDSTTPEYGRVSAERAVLPMRMKYLM